MAAAAVAFVATLAGLAAFGRSAHRWAVPAMDRVVAWWRWRPIDPPKILLDPDGEGVFVRAQRAYPAASYILGVHWRDLHGETVWMRPDADGEHWRRVPRSWWRDASLNLPYRWHRAIDYSYLVPAPEGTER